MNILLINHYAGSPDMGMEFRPYYLAKEWLKLGHSVTIVSGSFSHLRSHNPVLSRMYKEEMIDGIRYVWLKTPSYFTNGVKRAINMGVFVVLLHLFAKKLTAGFRPDLVIASSTYPLDIYPAKKIARKHKAKLVFEVHDLWPLSPMELGGMSKNHPFIRIIQKGEDYACRNADRIVSILPYANLHLETRGMAPEKYVHVPNGINIDDWENPRGFLPHEHRKILEGLKNDGCFIIGYAGSLGLANALDAFIESIIYIKNINVRYVLVGQGIEKERLIKKIEELGLCDKITFLPPVSKKVIPELLGSFDALFLGLKEANLFSFGVSPNKMIDYMMAGRPIINAVQARNNPVSDAQCGVSVFNSPISIAAGVTTIGNMSEQEREQLGKNGRAYILKNQTFDVLAMRFLEAVR